MSSDNYSLKTILHIGFITIFALTMTLLTTKANAEVYKCVAANGTTIYSDSHCRTGQTSAVSDKPNVTPAPAIDSRAVAMVAAEAAAEEARHSVIGMPSGAKNKPAHQPLRPMEKLRNKKSVTPTSQKQLEEYKIEQEAFTAMLSVHVIESMDPVCQKMMQEMSAAEISHTQSNTEEASPDLKALRTNWETHCKSKAIAAYESWPPPERKKLNPPFGNTPRCVAWVRKVYNLKSGGKSDVIFNQKLQNEMRSECQ